jgi:hypothetical protein
VNDPLTLLPGPLDINVSCGLVKTIPVHIVAQSVARSIVQILAVDNVWRPFTLAEVKANPHCYEGVAVVVDMLDELVLNGCLAKHEESYIPTEAFISYCTLHSQQQAEPEA